MNGGGGDDRSTVNLGPGWVYPDEAAAAEWKARRVIARHWHHRLTTPAGCLVGVLCRNPAGHAADLDLILPMIRPDPSQITKRKPADTRRAS